MPVPNSLLNQQGAIVSDIPTTGLSDNTVGAIAYITFVPAIFFLILPRYNARPYVRFHAWQSLLLSLVAFAVIFGMSFLAAPVAAFGLTSYLWVQVLLWTAWTLVWVLCAITALNGRSFKLPLLGTLAQKEANPSR
jgi:uncharacterized membrane protein